MGDVEQLRIDLDKFCSTEENTQNKFENIPSKSVMLYNLYVLSNSTMLIFVDTPWSNSYFSNSRNSFDQNCFEWRNAFWLRMETDQPIGQTKNLILYWQHEYQGMPYPKRSFRTYGRFSTQRYNNRKFVSR